ncbi:MAG TPA: lipopolysaccharide biosynthesis protein, partial [Anaerolineales bacterium]|nr:lipopolysaccharide biosynthesis protein [Anaerolineales bacterium]
MTHLSEDGDTSEKISVRHVGRGVMWSYLSFVLGKVMVFVSTVILARLLTPADFGLVGLASVLAGYLGTLHTFGVGEAFIQKKFGSEESANATFVLSVASGILLFLLSIIITPLVVIFFREPQIQSIFPVLAFTYVLTGLTTIHDALLVKELKFQQRLLPTFVQYMSKGIASIVLALMGFGAWAIVWGVLIGTLAKSITLIFVSPWRPSRAWDSKIAREIFGFGKFMVLQNIFGALEDNIDYMIVGRRLGVTDLGLYTLGYRAPEMAIISLPGVISNVAYPAYAKLQDDFGELQRSVRKTVQIISWLAIPAGLGLAMISSSFILTFYTKKWESTIPVMQLLSLYAMVYTLSYNFGDAYKAMGRPDILNNISISTILFTIFALWVGARYGIIGVAWAHLIRVLVLLGIQIVIVKRVLSIPYGDILKSIFNPLVCSIIMVSVMAFVSKEFQTLSTPLLLVLQLFVGGSTYLVSSFLINKDTTIFILN